jgi:hypothetical protein
MDPPVNEAETENSVQVEVAHDLQYKVVWQSLQCGRRGPWRLWRQAESGLHVEQSHLPRASSAC